MKMPRSTLGGRWRRYRALSRPERKLFRVAWWALLRASLALRFAERRTLARAMDHGTSAAPSDAPAASLVPAADLQKVAQAVASAAANHLWPMTCLPRSIALRRLLRARGIPARLEIGVRKESGSLAAHAWVEVDGDPVGEPEAIEERFLPLLAVRADEAHPR